ncbi:MAG TPA: hypothetical protein VHO48_08610, partial [Anaerolineaceae bacterium]|nr:hypothetical protein [Anaerolineaceae bacterium]
MSHNTNNKIRRVYHPEYSSVTVTLTSEYDFINDASEAAQLAYALLDKIDEQVFWILETTAVALPENL